MHFSFVSNTFNYCVSMQRSLYKGSVQVETAFPKKEIEDLRCASDVAAAVAAEWLKSS